MTNVSVTILTYPPIRPILTQFTFSDTFYEVFFYIMANYNQTPEPACESVIFLQHISQVNTTHSRK